MIELIPAIDIIEGKCVRLTKGDYATKKEYGDPVSMAQEFEQLGFKRLHVVDLDGAKNKHVVNDATLRAITRTTQLTVDFGGGVKTEEDLKKAYEAGATLVTVGSIVGGQRLRTDGVPYQIYASRHTKCPLHRDKQRRYAARACHKPVQTGDESPPYLPSYSKRRR